MQKVIWKYDLNTEGYTTVELPFGAKLRHLAYQDSTYGKGVKVWYQVDPAEWLKKEVRFCTVVTGEGIPRGGEYVGSATRPDGIVLHIFEVRE
jgi:hypothetical protein